MDDELPFASHITKRGRVYQNVRRVPEDLGDAFPFARVQRSLRTQDRATAYEAAARVRSEIEKRFAAARRKKGTTVNVIPIDDWDWTDWSQLADSFKAVLLDEDWRMRLGNIPGAAFDVGVAQNQFWRDTQTVRAHIDLQAKLRATIVADYCEERFGYVQGIIRALGVPLSHMGHDAILSRCNLLRSNSTPTGREADQRGGRTRLVYRKPWRRLRRAARRNRGLASGSNAWKR
jgi:hypothetical protein